MTEVRPPLANVFRTVFEFLRHRPDAVVFGAHAVNAYVETPRMTGDIDIMSTDASGLADDLRGLLADRFHIAVRVRVVAQDLGFRVYQLAEPKNRHLVDVRQVDELPSFERLESIQVIAPADLVVSKLSSFVERRNAPKGTSDWLDLQRMLLAFPRFRSPAGPVVEKLRGEDASQDVWDAFEDLTSEPIEPDNDDAY